MIINTYRIRGYSIYEGNTNRIDQTYMTSTKKEVEDLINMIEHNTKEFRGYAVKEMEYDTNTRKNKYIGEEVKTWGLK